jgi:diguanylate cyclase (GGDEF)-like protein
MPAGSSETGVLLAAGWTPCDYTIEQASILAVLAEQAASRLSSHRQLSVERANRRRTQTLLDVAQVVTRSPDLDTALTGICRAASKLSVAHQCTIFLDDGGGRPRPVTGWDQMLGLDGAHLDHFRTFQTMLLLERRAASLDELASLMSTLPLVLDDASQAPIAIRPWVDEFNIKSLAVYPLLARQGSVGVMNLTSHDRPVRFPADEIEAMSAIALQAAAVIEHLRLLEQVRRQAERDGLTGLYNRRALTDALQREIDATMRSGNPLAVALLDVDGMKRLNDSRGHAAGDMFLQRVAATLTATFRLTDIIARYGGDEFLVLMPATERATAVDLGRQFLSVLASEETGAGASIGIAVAPEDAETAADLLNAADAAMYTAKRSGYGGIARDRLMAAE